ncbi:nibrin isoform X2 [Hemicordylus capensis]|uniref:nibrin isoform X2 n=1 Tax=Hemicordylus capensis TaxID=884348 RepID=UPI00230389A1|nr:nibrin isoform X2 [Hemicordylus capensis]
MWKLVPVVEPGAEQSHRLLVGVEYLVGRKNCAILIQDDQSISRSHALLSVSHSQTNLSKSPTLPLLTLKDTSKYGTFVNEEKLPNGTSKTLKSGDRVTFGVFESKFRAEYEPLVVCSSCLDVSRKSVLNQNILQLGGRVTNEWEEVCTHLAMTSVKVTVKTICALVCGRPIIKPEFFAELIKAIQAKQQLPKPESFYPPIDEPSIKGEKIDLAVCPARKTIFRGKTFAFLTAKQHAKLSPAVKLGGGEAKLMTEGAVDAAALAAPDVCVIDLGFTNSQASISDSEREWIDTIIAVLQRRKYRTISEAEIGLAVIFASTERYCNPQTQLDAGAKSATSASAVPGPSLSQTAVVDETIMPGITDYIAAYVSDTETKEQMDTCMETAGKKRTKVTPVKEQRGKTHLQDMTVNETPSVSGTASTGGALSRLNRKSGIGQSSQAHLPSKNLGYGRNQDRSSQPQSNSIKNYFQPATKKRERIEDGETSISKYAKIEEKPPQSSDHTQPVPSLLWENTAESSQKGQCSIDQKKSQSFTDTSKKSVTENYKLETIASENIHAGKSASQKRKELDDFVEDSASLELVFESKELDWEVDTRDCGKESTCDVRKKRKLETKGDDLQEGNTGNEAKSILNLDKCASDSSNPPSRLLLTEFRSLVVSQPKKDGCFTTKPDYGHLNNFKKFKKTAYPGAGQLPHIIGGSDLVAHNARRDSEMEMWLKQEMEEQNRHAREESLADDLFRYDPHTRRR